jgi:hypothetical protein
VSVVAVKVVAVVVVATAAAGDKDDDDDEEEEEALDAKNEVGESVDVNEDDLLLPLLLGCGDIRFLQIQTPLDFIFAILLLLALFLLHAALPSLPTELILLSVQGLVGWSPRFWSVCSSLLSSSTH